MNLIVIIVFVVVFLVITNKKTNTLGEKLEENKETNKVKENSSTKERSDFFWSCKEIRVMIAACGIIYFASIVLPSIEFKIIHDIPKRDITINHDFGGNMHKPISFQFSDPGYPIKFEVRNK